MTTQFQPTFQRNVIERDKYIADKIDIADDTNIVNGNVIEGDKCIADDTNIENDNVIEGDKYIADKIDITDDTHIENGNIIVIADDINGHSTFST